MNIIHSNSTSTRINRSTITLEPCGGVIELQQPDYEIRPRLTDIQEECYTWNGKEWEKENG